jgi:hypothetical protein
VALMHDAILAEILSAQFPPDWREAVSAIASRTGDFLLAHRLADAQKVGVEAAIEANLQLDSG